MTIFMIMRDAKNVTSGWALDRAHAITLSIVSAPYTTMVVSVTDN